jgi:hypothetical protein
MPFIAFSVICLKLFTCQCEKFFGVHEIHLMPAHCKKLEMKWDGILFNRVLHTTRKLYAANPSIHAQ